MKRGAARLLCMKNIPRVGGRRRFLSIGEAAVELDRSTETLRRWDKSGKLPAIRIGWRRAYPIEQIEQVLRKRLAAAGPVAGRS